MLRPGDPAPDFHARTHEGEMISLSSFMSEKEESTRLMATSCDASDSGFFIVLHGGSGETLSWRMSVAT